MIDLKEFWTREHASDNDRWVSASDPQKVIERLGIDLEGVNSVLEIGPGRMKLADYLESIGKRVDVYDLVPLDDPRFAAELPLEERVDMAVAHLVFQHVPPEDHHSLIIKVLASLVPCGKFYFDAVSTDTSDNPALAKEYELGTSFPFTAWDLVTSKREASPGYFFCVIQR